MHLILIILIIHTIVSYDQNVSKIIFVKMDSMSGCNIRLVFPFPPKDSTLQNKKCVYLWNNFPCIRTFLKINNLTMPWLLTSKYNSFLLNHVWHLTQNYWAFFQTNNKKFIFSRPNMLAALTSNLIYMLEIHALIYQWKCNVYCNRKFSFVNKL